MWTAALLSALGIVGASIQLDATPKYHYNVKLSVSHNSEQFEGTTTILPELLPDLQNGPMLELTFRQVRPSTAPDGALSSVDMTRDFDDADHRADRESVMSIPPQRRRKNHSVDAQQSVQERRKAASMESLFEIENANYSNHYSMDLVGKETDQEQGSSMHFPSRPLTNDLSLSSFSPARRNQRQSEYHTMPPIGEETMFGMSRQGSMHPLNPTSAKAEVPLSSARPRFGSSQRIGSQNGNMEFRFVLNSTISVQSVELLVADVETIPDERSSTRQTTQSYWHQMRRYLSFGGSNADYATVLESDLNRLQPLSSAAQQIVWRQIPSHTSIVERGVHIVRADIPSPALSLIMAKRPDGSTPPIGVRVHYKGRLIHIDAGMTSHDIEAHLWRGGIWKTVTVSGQAVFGANAAAAAGRLGHLARIFPVARVPGHDEGNKCATELAGVEAPISKVSLSLTHPATHALHTATTTVIPGAPANRRAWSSAQQSTTTVVLLQEPNGLTSYADVGWMLIPQCRSFEFDSALVQSSTVASSYMKANLFLPESQVDPPRRTSPEYMEQNRELLQKMTHVFETLKKLMSIQNRAANQTTNFRIYHLPRLSHALKLTMPRSMVLVSELSAKEFVRSVVRSTLLSNANTYHTVRPAPWLLESIASFMSVELQYDAVDYNTALETDGRHDYGLDKITIVNEAAVTKGVAILSMVSTLVGKNVVLDCVLKDNTPLTAKAFVKSIKRGMSKSISWNSISAEAPEFPYTSNAVNINVSPRTILKSWAELPSYPVVKIDIEGRNLVISQFPFNPAASEAVWPVPIIVYTNESVRSYKSSSGDIATGGHRKSSSLERLSSSTQSSDKIVYADILMGTPIKVALPRSPIKLQMLNKHRQHGFYRVHYTSSAIHSGYFSFNALDETVSEAAEDAFALTLYKRISLIEGFAFLRKMLSASSEASTPAQLQLWQFVRTNIGALQLAFRADPRSMRRALRNRTRELVRSALSTFSKLGTFDVKAVSTHAERYSGNRKPEDTSTLSDQTGFHTLAIKDYTSNREQLTPYGHASLEDSTPSDIRLVKGARSLSPARSHQSLQRSFMRTISSSSIKVRPTMNNSRENLESMVSKDRMTPDEKMKRGVISLARMPSITSIHSNVQLPLIQMDQDDLVEDFDAAMFIDLESHTPQLNVSSELTSTQSRIDAPSQRIANEPSEYQPFGENLDYMEGPHTLDTFDEDAIVRADREVSPSGKAYEYSSKQGFEKQADRAPSQNAPSTPNQTDPLSRSSEDIWQYLGGGVDDNLDDETALNRLLFSLRLQLGDTDAVKTAQSLFENHYDGVRTISSYANAAAHNTLPRNALLDDVLRAAEIYGDERAWVEARNLRSGWHRPGDVLPAKYMRRIREVAANAAAIVMADKTVVPRAIWRQAVRYLRFFEWLTKKRLTYFTWRVMVGLSGEWPGFKDLWSAWNAATYDHLVALGYRGGCHLEMDPRLIALAYVVYFVFRWILYMIHWTQTWMCGATQDVVVSSVGDNLAQRRARQSWCKNVEERADPAAWIDSTINYQWRYRKREQTLPEESSYQVRVKNEDQRLEELVALDHDWTEPGEAITDVDGIDSMTLYEYR